MKNWLSVKPCEEWRLKSATVCCLQAGDPGQSVVFSLSPKA